MKNIIFAFILGLVLVACEKENEVDPCYDVNLVHDNACTTDCPGFIGCDGETYCNECEAARVGIGPQ